MRWTEHRFASVMQELLEENPIALRPLLTLAGWQFDAQVPTLAVTLGERSTLHVNPGFLETWCTTDDMAKAAVLHEFLHLLLGHTLRFSFIDDAHNIALDAVINAIIHRQMGGTFSALFSTYYQDSVGPLGLLRHPGFPLTDEDPLHRGLYDRTVVAEDILGILESVQERTAPDPQASRAQRRQNRDSKRAENQSRRRKLGFPDCIGSHDPAGMPAELPQNLREAFESTLRSAAGNELGRQLSQHAGVRGRVFTASVSPLRSQWKRAARTALRACLDKMEVSRWTGNSPTFATLPVLSTTDRRGFLRVGWSPFLPESEHRLTGPLRSGEAQVYLDVSGSIRDELSELVHLLRVFQGLIARPIWTFADTVEPARFEHGGLVTRSSDGTNIEVVLDHIARTRPAAALIVTDGELGPIPKAMMAQCAGTRICALVTGEGDPRDLKRAGIPVQVLDPLPS